MKNRPSGLTYIKKPTERQKKVLAMAIKNRGKIQPAMEAAGYSKQTSKNPQNLTNSKSWSELLTQCLPDDLLVQITMEGLEATKNNGNKELIPDYVVRHRYLETALKIKGKLNPKNDEDTVKEQVVGITFVVPKECATDV